MKKPENEDAGAALHASELDERRAADQDTALERAFLAGALPEEDRRAAGEQLEGVHASDAGEQLEGVHASDAGEQLEDSAPATGQLEKQQATELAIAQLAKRLITLGLVLERVAAAVVKVHDNQHGTHNSTVTGDIAAIREFLGECEAARAEAAAAGNGG
jgi:hypothetical protein